MFLKIVSSIGLGFIVAMLMGIPIFLSIMFLNRGNKQELDCSGCPSLENCHGYCGYIGLSGRI